MVLGVEKEAPLLETLLSNSTGLFSRRLCLGWEHGVGAGRNLLLSAEVSPFRPGCSCWRTGHLSSDVTVRNADGGPRIKILALSLDSLTN